MNPFYISLGICSSSAIGIALTSVLYLVASGIEDAAIRRRRTVIFSIAAQIILISPACLLIFTKATDLFMRCHLHWACPDLISATFCSLAALASSLTIKDMAKALHPEDADIVKMHFILSCLDLLLFLESMAVIAANFIR